MISMYQIITVFYYDKSMYQILSTVTFAIVNNDLKMYVTFWGGEAVSNMSLFECPIALGS